jgi:hypothetical protein
MSVRKAKGVRSEKIPTGEMKTPEIWTGFIPDIEDLVIQTVVGKVS